MPCWAQTQPMFRLTSNVCEQLVSWQAFAGVAFIANHGGPTAGMRHVKLTTRRAHKMTLVPGDTRIMARFPRLLKKSNSIGNSFDD